MIEMNINILKKKSLFNFFLEKPLVFSDIQGGFYLLGFGFICTFIVHLCLIVKVRCCS